MENKHHNIIQIATPYATGTGFYLNEFNLIITNRHVVEGLEEVTISGRLFKKQSTIVLCQDAAYDLAFLEAPENVNWDELKLSDVPVNVGELVHAIGHPLGLKYSLTQGIISNINRQYHNVQYIQTDAAISPGNSGGPLLNGAGQVVGVNTFVYNEGSNLGFALPASILKQCLIEYLPIYKQKAIRCQSCLGLINLNVNQDLYCFHCGAKIPESDIHPKIYEPFGIGLKVEPILNALGVPVNISRVGSNYWVHEIGDCKVKIYYQESSRFIYIDTVLGVIPKEQIVFLYEYLLKENSINENIVFSVNNQDIMLSLLIHEDDYVLVEAEKMILLMFEKIEYYCSILQNQFNVSLLNKED